jgi:hypothetical protein
LTVSFADGGVSQGDIDENPLKQSRGGAAMAVEGKMRRIFSIVLCSISGFIIMACAAQQTGDSRIENIARFKTGMAYGLAIKGSHAYITTNSDLIIIDIADPKKPRRAGRLKISTPIFGLKVVDRTAFLAASDKGLIIVDISDKTNPTEVTTVKETQGASSVEIDGNRLFLGFFDGSIKIFDITDPKSPGLLAEMACPGEVLGLVSADFYLFINYKGVIVKDISDLNAIVDVGHHRRMKGAHGIVYRDGYVYYVKNGLTIFKIVKF